MASHKTRRASLPIEARLEGQLPVPRWATNHYVFDGKVAPPVNKGMTKGLISLHKKHVEAILASTWYTYRRKTKNREGAEQKGGIVSAY